MACIPDKRGDSNVNIFNKFLHLLKDKIEDKIDADFMQNQYAVLDQDNKFICQTHNGRLMLDLNYFPDIQFEVNTDKQKIEQCYEISEPMEVVTGIHANLVFNEHDKVPLKFFELTNQDKSFSIS